MGKAVTNGEIAIGYEYFKGVRKKPCIVVRIGNEYFTLGTFANEGNAEFFVDKLSEMVGAKEESVLAEKGGTE
ncbi:MAG: hypothetical protein IKT67_12905 [Lachnospiraceae bacterium]|nr:hypothetical protein [Lachnospiraceae bacterium]